jgi:histo-blood group ABO system transferase
MMKVGLLVIATNKYLNYARSLYQSMQAFFLNEPGIACQMFLFTDQPAFPGPVVLDQPHEPWPAMTLKRYEIFYKHRQRLAEMDYLYYCDADMLFVDQVGQEILGERVATRHPGFWNCPRPALPYETNPASTAYVAPEEGGVYYAGGFNGGSSAAFLEMARVISANIRRDLNRGYIAVWHDESHLNRYLIDHPPSVTLNPAYCFPEADWAQGLPFRRILMALDKNHDEVRN